MKEPNLLFKESGDKMIPKVPQALIFWENMWVASLMEGKVKEGDATGEGR